MKPPTTLQWLAGNPVSALVLVLGAIYLVWFWLAESGGIGFGLLAIIVGGYAARSAERVNAYSRWKRQWEGMGGGSGGIRLPRPPSLRVVLGVGSWIVLAILALDGSNGDPMVAVAINLFWVGTGVLGMSILYRRLRSDHRRSQDKIVSVSLPVPNRSSNVDHARVQIITLELCGIR